RESDLGIERRIFRHDDQVINCVQAKADRVKVPSMGWLKRDLHIRFLRRLSMGYDSKGYATETRRNGENPGQNNNGKRNSSYFAFSLFLRVSVPLWLIPNTVTLDEKL